MGIGMLLFRQFMPEIEFTPGRNSWGFLHAFLQRKKLAAKMGGGSYFHWFLFISAGDKSGRTVCCCREFMGFFGPHPCWQPHCGVASCIKTLGLFCECPPLKEEAEVLTLALEGPSTPDEWMNCHAWSIWDECKFAAGQWCGNAFVHSYWHFEQHLLGTIL